MDNPRQHRLADLLVLAALFCLAGWYLWDSWRASAHVYNLIFVLPLTLVILLLCAIAFVRDLTAPPAQADDLQREQDTGSLPAISVFIGYVVSLPWLGFDVGTFVFLALYLRLAGESRWQWTLGYSLVFALGSALFFSYMLPYPMPLLLLPGGG